MLLFSVCRFSFAVNSIFVIECWIFSIAVFCLLFSVWCFLFAVFSIVASLIVAFSIDAIIPLFYKDFFDVLVAEGSIDGKKDELISILLSVLGLFAIQSSSIAS